MMRYKARTSSRATDSADEERLADFEAFAGNGDKASSALFAAR
jgi:hypothetical protein